LSESVFSKPCNSLGRFVKLATSSIKEQEGSIMENSDMPSYYIGYHVQETESGKSWTRVATAWPYRNDQGGFTVELHAVLLSGTIVFLPSGGKDKLAASFSRHDGDIGIA
jgi:hypothetical protein